MNCVFMAGNCLVSHHPSQKALWSEPLRIWWQDWERRNGKKLQVFSHLAAWHSGYSGTTVATSQLPGTPASLVPSWNLQDPLTFGNSWYSQEYQDLQAFIQRSDFLFYEPELFPLGSSSGNELGNKIGEQKQGFLSASACSWSLGHP